MPTETNKATSEAQMRELVDKLASADHERWGRLHAVRSFLSLAAAATFLWLLIRA